MWGPGPHSRRSADSRWCIVGHPRYALTEHPGSWLRHHSTSACQLTGFHRGLWPLQCRPRSVLVLNKDVPLLGRTHDWAQAAICDARVDRYVPNPCRRGECGGRDQVRKKLGLREATGLFLLGTHRNGWLFWRHENDLGSCMHTKRENWFVV